MRIGGGRCDGFLLYKGRIGQQVVATKQYTDRETHCDRCLRAVWEDGPPRRRRSYACGRRHHPACDLCPYPCPGQSPVWTGRRDLLCHRRRGLCRLADPSRDHVCRGISICIVCRALGRRPYRRACRCAGGDRGPCPRQAGREGLRSGRPCDRDQTGRQTRPVREAS